MEAKNFKHRLYVNEYDSEFVRQLINNKIDGLFCTDESTNDVLVIVGTLENLDKLSGLMYRSAEEIKAVFPDFLTADDYNRDVCQMHEIVMGTIRNELAKLATKYNGTAVEFQTSAAVARKMAHDILNYYVDNEICGK